MSCIFALGARFNSLYNIAISAMKAIAKSLTHATIASACTRVCIATVHQRTHAGYYSNASANKSTFAGSHREILRIKAACSAAISGDASSPLKQCSCSSANASFPNFLCMHPRSVTSRSQTARWQRRGHSSRPAYAFPKKRKANHIGRCNIRCTLKVPPPLHLNKPLLEIHDRSKP